MIIYSYYPTNPVYSLAAPEITVETKSLKQVNDFSYQLPLLASSVNNANAHSVEGKVPPRNTSQIQFLWRTDHWLTSRERLAD